MTLRNHETAIVGGFITETNANDRRGIPVLSSVPILGNAFTTAEKARTRTELVFFVTVNAEEPPALVPIDADDPAPRATAVPSSSGAAPAEPLHRTERIDVLGFLS